MDSRENIVRYLSLNDYPVPRGHNLHKKTNNIVITFTNSMKNFRNINVTQEPVAWETARLKTFLHSHILEGFVPERNESFG
jgi:tRNA nucleotidyltransferase (CCA-adding enzyme)